MYENKILFEIQDYYKKVQQVFLSIFEDLIPERFFLTWQWFPLYIIIIIHILYVIVTVTIKKSVPFLCIMAIPLWSFQWRDTKLERFLAKNQL